MHPKGYAGCALKTTATEDLDRNMSERALMARLLPVIQLRHRFCLHSI
jgi:hypothetical protein